MADKPIVITLTIYPLDKAKVRHVAISGAAEGDMPVMHTTTFAGLHPAINAVWAELIARGAQPVKVGAVVAAAPQPEAPTAENDQLVASTETPALSSIDTPATEETSND
jgi:hypothetical protein